MDKGFISLLILFVIFFLSWIGFQAFYKASSQERIVRYEAEKVKAIFLSDSGLEWAKASLIKNPTWKGGVRQFNNGKIKVEIIKNNQSYRVISRSESENAVQNRYGEFIEDNNKGLILKSYGELFN